MNPYVELDLPIDATEEEIKIKFRSLAQIHHPDKGGDEEVFVRIKLAYEILIDPIRRREFDVLGESSEDLQIRNSAMNLLTDMLNRYISTINPERDNLIDIMKAEVIKIKNDMSYNTEICDNHISHLQKIIRRLNSKNKKRNILLELLEPHLNQRKSENTNFEHNIKICDLVLSILDDHYYSYEELISIANSSEKI